MIERRTKNRTRSLIGAQVQFGNGTQVYDCLIRNVSANGARVELEHTAALPPHFMLDIPNKGTRCEARIVWRSLHAAGLEFSSSMSSNR